MVRAPELLLILHGWNGVHFIRNFYTTTRNMCVTFYILKKKCSHNSISTLLIIKISYKKKSDSRKKNNYFLRGYANNANHVLRIIKIRIIKYVFV